MDFATPKIFLAEINLSFDTVAFFLVLDIFPITDIAIIGVARVNKYFNNAPIVIPVKPKPPITKNPNNPPVNAPTAIDNTVLFTFICVSFLFLKLTTSLYWKKAKRPTNTSAAGIATAKDTVPAKAITPIIAAEVAKPVIKPFCISVDLFNVGFCIALKSFAFILYTIKPKTKESTIDNPAIAIKGSAIVEPENIANAPKIIETTDPWKNLLNKLISVSLVKENIANLKLFCPIAACAIAVFLFFSV